MLRSKGITNYKDYFRHNKEYWQQRVRMQTPKCEDYTRSIDLIEAFFMVNEATKEYYISEMKDYFEDFRTKCIQGYFQELNDILMHKWNGRDKDGLSLWLRFRGSNRYKNYHQKLKFAICLLVVSPHLSHFILLVLTY